MIKANENAISFDVNFIVFPLALVVNKLLFYVESQALNLKDNSPRRHEVHEENNL